MTICAIERIENIRANYDSDDAETFAVDLLADLLLWCHENGIDGERVTRIAREHFESEVSE